MEYQAFLDDGTRVIFRLIRPTDKEMLARGFGELSERSRYERFLSPVKRLSETQLRYLTEVDHQNHSAWVAIALAGDRQRGLGVGRWVRVPDESEVAEVAVTVIDAFHNLGIGRTLLYLCTTSAHAKGIRALRAMVLSDNRATLRMFEMMGATRGKWRSGAIELTVPLDTAMDSDLLLPLRLEPLPT